MTENPRSNGRNEKHPAPVPENIQTGLAQSRGQFLHHLRGRTRFVRPCLLDCAPESAIWEPPAEHTVDCQLVGAAQQAGKMILAKIAFRLSKIGERERGLAGPGRVSRD